MGSYKIGVEKFGNDYLLINWPSRIDPKISEELLQFEVFLNEKFKDIIIETNPTYASLCVRFNPLQSSFDDLEKTVKVTYLSFNSSAEENITTWEVPVCYHSDLAPDIISFCEQKEMTFETLIDCHTFPIYRVYFLGFLPGFLYLGGMDERLNLP